VLDQERLARVAERLSAGEKRSLLAGLRALVRAADAGGRAKERT
jgi:hypothetical protein